MSKPLIAAMVAALVALPGAALAAEKAGAKPAAQAPAQAVKFSVVAVNEQEIFRLADTRDLTGVQRADELRKRLHSVLEPDPGEKWQSVQPSDVTVENVDQQPIIRLRNQNVISVTAQDAQLNKKTSQDLAQRWAEELRSALKTIKVEKGNKLPQGFVSVATGEIRYNAPRGGGAGGAPPEQLGPLEPGEK